MFYRKVVDSNFRRIPCRNISRNVSAAPGSEFTWRACRWYCTFSRKYRLVFMNPHKLVKKSWKEIFAAMIIITAFRWRCIREFYSSIKACNGTSGSRFCCCSAWRPSRPAPVDWKRIFTVVHLWTWLSWRGKRKLPNEHPLEHCVKH